MTPPDAMAVGAWIVGAGAVAGALFVLGKLIRSAWRGFRSVSHFLDDWHGTPARPGRPATPGFPERTEALERHTGSMCERIARLDSKVTSIEHEMHPNSGRSLRDQVDKIVDVTRAEEP